MQEFRKELISLRYWLLGRGYLLALAALDFAQKHHTGVRKDGVTPEFAHPVQVCHFLRAFEPLMLFPEETFCAALLHDVVEDYDISLKEIERRFGVVVRKAVASLTKKYKGEKKSEEKYFTALSRNPVGALVKGSDRINNQQTMQGAFSYEKQQGYLVETETWILPMLKRARRLFPKQDAAFESIKYMLTSQMELIREIHKAATVSGQAPNPS